MVIVMNVTIKDWILIVIIFSAGLAYIAKSEETLSVQYNNEIEINIVV